MLPDKPRRWLMWQLTNWAQRPTRSGLHARRLLKMNVWKLVAWSASGSGRPFPRSDLADPEALTAALQSGHLGAAALDVFDPEPIPASHPLRAMANVILSPHLASCSVPAVTKLRKAVAHLAVAAVLGQPLANIVNGVHR